eukprot:13400129-Alexandrium_andersonii.AAC.1
MAAGGVEASGPPRGAVIRAPHADPPGAEQGPWASPAASGTLMAGSGSSSARSSQQPGVRPAAPRALSQPRTAR